MQRSGFKRLDWLFVKTRGKNSCTVPHSFLAWNRRTMLQMSPRIGVLFPSTISLLLIAAIFTLKWKMDT